MIGGILIHHVENGFVLTIDSSMEIYPTTEELFARLLFFFEGRRADYYDSAYGRVVIERERKQRPAHTDRHRKGAE